MCEGLSAVSGTLTCFRVSHSTPRPHTNMMTDGINIADNGCAIPQTGINDIQNINHRHVCVVFFSFFSNHKNRSGLKVQAKSVNSAKLR